ncbi:hypothetical protein [Synechococcus sp. MIT S1220]|uniref:hypothetical protein n=1 Tax=Synechococcus sp. MIT S1220 TaxID=3082549 RepID=UPI0039AFCAA9
MKEVTALQKVPLRFDPLARYAGSLLRVFEPVHGFSVDRMPSKIVHINENAFASSNVVDMRRNNLVLCGEDFD